MTIHTCRYVHVDDVLPAAVLEVFNEADLPWTFGDCHLSCIRRESLLERVEEWHAEGDVSDEDMEAVRVILTREPDQDVLIAL